MENKTHQEMYERIKEAYKTTTESDKEEMMLFADSEYGQFKRMQMGQEHLFESAGNNLNAIMVAFEK